MLIPARPGEAIDKLQKTASGVAAISTIVQRPSPTRVRAPQATLYVDLEFAYCLQPLPFFRPMLKDVETGVLDLCLFLS